jgi:ATP-dependent DNA helicase RecG
MKLSTPIENLSYVNLKNAHRFKKMGINNLKDLLFHFPRTYKDYTHISLISHAKVNEEIILQARISNIKMYRSPRKKMFITEAIIEDKSGALPIIWFNQPFIARQLKNGYLINLMGEVKKKTNKLTLFNPTYEIIQRPDGRKTKKDPLHSERIVPIYHETSKITSKYLRFIIWFHLKKLEKIKDPLPHSIISKHDFLTLSNALKQVHFPDSWHILKKAQKRLAFNELFLIRFFLEKQKITRQNTEKSFSIPFQEKLVKKFVSNLPFKLTDDQKKAAWSTIKDMEKSYPTQRLLEGDVGSGKTVVAAIASLSVVSAGYQVAFMAPTEVLARQHFNQLAKDLKNIQVDIALLIGAEARLVKHSKKKSEKIKKTDLYKKLANGEIKFVIGTHALIQKNINFQKLAFVVVDEQHRFGVDQRARLLQSIVNEDDSKQEIYQKKVRKLSPHLLSMSATPIPRTLSLVFYGDLQISRLRQLPSGRKKIMTEIVFPKDRSKIYNFVKQKIREGRQAFVICPLIEESEKLQTKTVQGEFQKLTKEIFPNLKIGLLHGKMKSQEKKEMMQKFLKKKIDMLVATSVIEVGIDVPNATIILIEGTERFGLSQLHQLRGRVGRSNYQSYCFLFTEIPSQNVIKRLKTLTKSNNGFELAEKDLQLRGPGDFIGKRQSGIPDLVMASLKDIELIQMAKKEAQNLLRQDPNLTNCPLLRQKIAFLQKKAHLE